MWWAISAILAITGAVVQLRYLTLSQNNAYVLPKSVRFIKFYLYTSLAVVVVFIFSALSVLIEEKIVYATLFLTVFSLIIILCKIFSYRTKFKFTERGTIYFIFSLFLHIFEVSIIAVLVKKPSIIALTICPVILAEPLIIAFVSCVLNFVYNRKNANFISKQKDKVIRISPIIVGITGSYGKTSCKNILKNFLSDDFRVCCTEKNYNTPIGVALTAEKMSNDVEIFIAEFGARKRGDIKELCTLFSPSYGIITGVCEQHTETFGSLEDVYKEKFELARSVYENGGTCVFNGNDKNVLRMWREYRGKKIVAASYKKGDVYADEITLDSTGSRFTLNVRDKKYLCKTALLGRHNIQNIVMCAALAVELGCDVEKIVKKIENLPQVPHRLEYTFANGVYILDDGYNGNVYGIRSAFEVLSVFPKRHVVVSQGIVELGEKAAETNENIGRELACVADVAILSGVNAKYIEKGLKSKNFQGRIIIAKNMKCVKKCIKSTVKIGDTVLLQNDVSDIY